MDKLPPRNFSIIIKQGYSIHSTTGVIGQLQKFRFPSPVDPFGKSSGRDLLTLEHLRVSYLLEFTRSEVESPMLPVTTIRRPRTWRTG